VEESWTSKGEAGEIFFRGSQGGLAERQGTKANSESNSGRAKRADSQTKSTVRTSGKRSKGQFPHYVRRPAGIESQEPLGEGIGA